MCRWTDRRTGGGSDSRNFSGYSRLLYFWGEYRPRNLDTTGRAREQVSYSEICVGSEEDNVVTIDRSILSNSIDSFINRISHITMSLLSRYMGYSCFHNAYRL